MKTPTDRHHANLQTADVPMSAGPTDGPRIPFAKALAACGLLDAFIEYCRAGASEAQAQAWVRKHPRIGELCWVPAKFKNVRKSLGCPTSHGGARPPARKGAKSAGHNSQTTQTKAMPRLSQMTSPPKGWIQLTRKFLPSQVYELKQFIRSVIACGQYSPDDLCVVKSRGECRALYAHRPVSAQKEYVQCRYKHDGKVPPVVKDRGPISRTASREC